MSTVSLIQKIQTHPLNPADLVSVPSKDIVEALKDVFKESIERGEVEKAYVLLNEMASLISTKQVGEALGVKDLLKEAKDSLDAAKIYLGSTEAVPLPVYLQEVLDTMILVIDSFVNAFGFGDFFAPPENQIDAEQKSQKIFQLTSNFSMLSAALLPAVGAETAAKILSGVLAFIAALSLIWAKIKPMPSFLPANGENWSRETRPGKFVHTVSLEVLQRIDQVLKSGMHPMLVGVSRAGKSIVAKAYAQYVTQTRGMGAFRINTSDLVNRLPSYKGGNNNILKEIHTAMGGHEDRILLILDEVHMACKPDEPLADQMKPYLDEGGKFPHVLGITTNLEFEEFIEKNRAFKNRFQKVNILSAEKSEVLRVLSTTALRQNDKPILDEEVLEYIYDKSLGEDPQPNSAKKLLGRCLARTSLDQLSELEVSITRLSERIYSLRSQEAAYGSPASDLKSLQTELKGLQDQLEENKVGLAILAQARKNYHHVRKMAYESVLKAVSAAHQNLNTKEEREMRRYLLADRILRSALRDFIKEKSAILKVTSIIDKSLVDQVLADNAKQN